MKKVNFLVGTILAVLFLLCSTKAFAQKQINIDFAAEVDTIKNFLGGNKGPGSYGSYLNELGMRYLRTHDYHGAADYCFYSSFWNTDESGNFTTINPSFDPDNPLHYDWTETDNQLMQIISGGFEIYFRIGVSYPNPMYPMATYEPPVDSYLDTLSFSRFAELCRRTVMHYNDGWDDGYYYDIKYFELWNEPGGIFWEGSAVQYCRMFQAVSDSIKSFDPSIKIGGPGAVPTTTIGLHPEYREGFIRFLDSTDTDIDFYSWHIYGAKNPFCLKEYADTIRTLLDISGFIDAEIHITEINHNLDSTLDSFVPSPLGAAYYLSLVLTAQKSPVDLFLWYPCAAFSVGDILYTPSANSMIAFHLMQEETPIIVHSTGEEVIDGHFDTDTTNFMVLAAKSEDENKLYILVSNYHSDNVDYEVNITNLPWGFADSIEVRRNLIVDTLNFAEFVDTISGGDSLTIFQPDMAAPSVLFLRLEKLSPTNVRENSADVVDVVDVFPNPFNSSVVITVETQNLASLPEIAIYDLHGNVICRFDGYRADCDANADFIPGQYIFQWHPDEKISSGIYLVRIVFGDERTFSKRIVYVR